MHKNDFCQQHDGIAYSDTLIKPQQGAIEIACWQYILSRSGDKWAKSRMLANLKEAAPTSEKIAGDKAKDQAAKVGLPGYKGEKG